MKVFIVTKYDADVDDDIDKGHVQRGVYSTESRAVAACLDKKYEYCEVTVDKDFKGEYADTWINPKENPEQLK